MTIFQTLELLDGIMLFVLLVNNMLLIGCRVLQILGIFLSISFRKQFELSAVESIRLLSCLEDERKTIQTYS